MDKISIVIPFFNTEIYIRKCLDSIINQTMNNLEILVINDGSADGTGFICDEYANKDNRIRVFHQKHLGLSAALNIGLSNVTGDYVCFADSDDWAEPDWCEKLLAAVKSVPATISIAGFFIDTDTTSTAAFNRLPITPEILTTENLLMYPLNRNAYQGFCGYLWNKLFSANTIRTAGLCFDENIKYGMDCLFYVSLVIAQQCTGVYIDEPLYHYYQRNVSITQSTDYNIKLDILTVYKRIEDMLRNSSYKNLAFWANAFFCHHSSVIAEIAHRRNDKNMLIKMQENIRNSLDDYIKSNLDYPTKFDRMYDLLNIKA